jgi:hypothetical protein
MQTAIAEAPVTGITVLNYHHPEETVACVVSLLEREPATSRILWIENDAARTREALMTVLATAPFPWVEVEANQGPLPPAGTVGVILCPENLGYAGGNNVGLRLLHHHGVPFGWVLNNDTCLQAGSSRDLVAASRARPDVGAWGTVVRTLDGGQGFGGVVQTRNFASKVATTAESLNSPLAYVGGCSLFMPIAIAAKIGFIPEDYFLYYEDTSFSLLLKQAGYKIGGLETVVVLHLEYLSTGGKCNPLVIFYNQRNRWFFIERFFPGQLAAQKRRLWYTIQKFLFRGKFFPIYLEMTAYRDYQRGKLGRTERVFSTTGHH